MRETGNFRSWVPEGWGPH